MSNSKSLYAKPLYPYKWVPGGLEGGPPVREITDLEGIQADMKLWGFCIVKAFTNQQMRDETKEIFRKNLFKQGWSDEYAMKIYGPDGSLLDVDNPAHDDAFIAAVTRPLTPKEREAMKKGMFPGMTFGRACCPGATLTNLQVELRNSKEWNNFSRAVMGLKPSDLLQVREEYEGLLWRLPTLGQFVDAHVDMSWYEYIRRLLEGDDTIHVLQRKYHLLVGGTFTCVPGSQSEEFRREFYAKYAKIYNFNSKDSKSQFDKDRPDPMDVLGNKKVFEVPPGCAVCWSPFVIHTHSTVPSNSPPVGGALMGASLCTPESAKRYLEKAGVPQCVDRFCVWSESGIGILWPSGALSPYDMNNAMCFPEIMKGLLQKLPKETDRIGSFKLKSGEVRPKLLPPDTSEYVPPFLTAHGIEDLLCHSQEPVAHELRIEVAMVQAAVVAAKAAGTPTKWRDFLKQPLKWNRKDFPPVPTAESMRIAARAAAAAKPKSAPKRQCPANGAAGGASAPKRQRKAKQAAVPLSEVMQGKQPADAEMAKQAADDETAPKTKRQANGAAGGASAPKEKRKKKCKAKQADESDSDGGAAGAGFKRKPRSFDDSEEEPEAEAAPGPVGGAVADDSDDDVIDMGYVVAQPVDDSDDDVIFVPKNVVDLTGDD
jgi:hypothetical protein